jgi:formylglycine-generating enzyme required for sulfatase activity
MVRRCPRVGIVGALALCACPADLSRLTDGQGATDGGFGDSGARPVEAGGSTDAPPSCDGGGPGRNDCGPQRESCCTSLPVSGGTFYRGYDAVTFTDKTSPATVSDFRLDKYEITVGRFRKFVEAALGGYRPAQRSGRHLHVNGGKGLAVAGADAGLAYELGWDASWGDKFELRQQDWDAGLYCASPPYSTWSTVHADGHPINCITWYQAYAFCIWDGGFLPSEAEWNYAASGGSEQRVYPWSTPPTSTAITCAFADYVNGIASCVQTGTKDVGSTLNGAGAWGHVDLAGNVGEWVLDVYVTPYPTPCTDCAALGPGASNVARGGGFTDEASGLFNSVRNDFPPNSRDQIVGARCARAP